MLLHIVAYLVSTEVSSVSAIGPSITATKPPAFAQGSDGVDPWFREPPPLWQGTEKPWNVEPYNNFDPDRTPMLNVTLIYEQVGKATKYNLGINTPVYVPKKFYDKFGVDIIKDGGFKFLRWPGGSVADNYIWNFDFKSFSWFRNQSFEHPDYPDTDDFIKLCKATGAEPIVQANYAVFVKYGAAAGTDLAKKWLRHFKANGLDARYWTLGNENYGLWETPNAEPVGRSLDGDIYGWALRNLSAGLKAIDPEVYVGAVVTASEDMHVGPMADAWMRTLGPHLKEAADFAELHTYFMDLAGDYAVPSTQDIYDHDKNYWIGSLKWNVENLTQEYGNVSLPLAVTEWNIDLVHPRSDDTPDQHISALIVPDLVTRMMMWYGFDANNYFSFSDALLSKYFRPYRVPGDLGIVTRDDPTAYDGTPRPAWYAYALMSRVIGNTMYAANVTQGPAGYWSESVSSGQWVDVTSKVQAHAWTFSTGEVGVLLTNRHHPDNPKEQIAVCLQGLEEFKIPPGSPVRGWVVSPGNPYATDPARDKGTRWNGKRGKTTVGGPYPLNDIQALSANTTGIPADCAAVLTLPPASVVGVVFYKDSSRWIDPPSKSNGALGSSATDYLHNFMHHFLSSVLAGWVIYAGVSIVLLAIVVRCLRKCCRNLSRPNPSSSQTHVDVPFHALFQVRRVGLLAFILVMYFDFTYLVWLPLHGWNDGVTWYGILYFFSEFIATFSGIAFYICSCFKPRPLKPDDEWTSEDTDAMLMKRAQAEHAVIVQCHYNEPVEEIVESLCCNLQYFTDHGFSRDSRKYYILDDGFYTGEGETRRLRQVAFCKALRYAVQGVLGTNCKNATQSASDEVPLALSEGRHIDNVWRTDCASGFLIWSVGNESDHVYLVARDKPNPHHSKAGNINNFLYNVLRLHFARPANVDSGLNSIDSIPALEAGLLYDECTIPTYMLLLDQDMCLGHEYITSLPNYRNADLISMAKPVFESDLKRICFVQFPQYFKDMHKMDVTFNSNATFYKAVQIGRGAVGLAAFAGTNCVWDISKLFSIGGVQYGSVTEDSNTSIVAHRRGLRSRYIDTPVAAGNSPQTVEDAIKQVCSRWAKGAIDMLLQRCSSKHHPESLCIDVYRAPPPGLESAYGLDKHAHFKKDTQEMQRTFLEGFLMRVFSVETMVFPFWSLIALIHVVLASWLCISMESPIALEVSTGFFVVMAHMLSRLLYPLVAFPQVRVVEIWYSMGTWMGLAPTMFTHAVLTSFKEKCCPCGRRAQWTSIGQRKVSFYKSQLGIVAIAAILFSLILYRACLCLLAPVVPLDTCPEIGKPSEVSGKMLPSIFEVQNYHCGFAEGAWGDAGGQCGLLQDDMSAIYCHCCCQYSGQCGYAGRDLAAKGSMRPAGTEGPCNRTKTVGALLYASILFFLSTPWVYAVFRDLRRFGYVQGIHAQERVQSIALLGDSADPQADPLTRSIWEMLS